MTATTDRTAFPRTAAAVPAAGPPIAPTGWEDATLPSVPASSADVRRRPVARTTVLRLLVGMQTRLLSREWAVVLFAFVFPPLMMLLLAGVFGGDVDPVYGGVDGSTYYVASYLAVPLGSLSMIGLPVLVASDREHGVLRRMEAFGIPVRRVVTAQALVAALLVLLGAALVLVAAALGYGIPAVERPGMVALAGLVGLVVMVLLGALLGFAVRTARAAQALGLLLFMPQWILGGGGPPRGVMDGAAGAVADVLPMSRVTAAVRGAWFGNGPVGGHLLWLAGWGVLAAMALFALGRRTDG